MNVQKVKTLDPTLLTFGKENENQRGCMVYYKVSDTDYEKLRIQTPRLKICFDPSVRRDRNDNIFIKNLSHSLELIGNESNEKNIQSFEKKLKKIEKIVQKIVPDTVKRNKQFASSFWQKGEYAPTIKSTIKYYKGEANIRVFDKARNVITEKEIVRGSIMSCVFALDQIWLSGDKYGINWVTEQAVIYQDSAKEPSPLFRDE